MDSVVKRKMDSHQLRHDLQIEDTPFETIPDNLLQIAFTHVTGTSIHEESYERYEFLGDSILGMAVSDLIFKHYRLSPEWMTNIRKEVVENKVLAQYMCENKLEKYIKCGRGTSVTGSISADVFEAIIGVLYVYISDPQYKNIQIYPLHHIQRWLHSICNISGRIHMAIERLKAHIGIDLKGYYSWTSWSESYVDVDGNKMRVRYQHNVYRYEDSQVEYKPYREIVFIPYSEYKGKSTSEKREILYEEIILLRNLVGDYTLLDNVINSIEGSLPCTEKKLNSWKMDLYYLAIEYL